ncbi:MAG: HDOD domain-containing protein [Candidatus Krumholzibacteriia bacterium]
MSRREEILSQVRTVPSLPAVVLKLREYLNDPEVSFDDVARVIEYDPGLTANVLQLANSAFFGWSREISSVRDAVTRLGTQRVFQMVLCMSVAPLVRKPVRGYDLDPDALWEHSIAVAICAERLAQNLNLSVGADAFTAGLLHDLGKVVLGTFVEIDDEPIREIVELDRLAFDESERMVLGIDHAEVAGVLLQEWNVPPGVVQAARWHHEPGRCGSDHQLLADLVHVSDVLCLNVGWGLGSDGRQYRLDERAAARLDVNIAAAEDVVLAVVNGLEEMHALFQPETAEVSGGARQLAR